MLPAATACNSGFQIWVRRAFHQGDGRPPAPAQAIAEAGDEFQPSRAAAHHHDAVRRAFRRRAGSRVRPTFLGADQHRITC